LLCVPACAAAAALLCVVTSGHQRLHTHARRSTFPGAGKWAGHWTGDNGANWENMRQSTASVLNSNMWGMAMTGADVCGFLDAAPYLSVDMGDPPRNRLADGDYEELCNRWTSAGAFYPFVRNHYTWDSRSHEPYRCAFACVLQGGVLGHGTPWPAATATLRRRCCCSPTCMCA
jgi:hypothetical protein